MEDATLHVRFLHFENLICKVPPLLSNESQLSFIKQTFYWFFMPPGKDLEWGCSGNLGPALGSCLTVGALIPRTPPFWVFSLHIIMSKKCLKQK
jgi:hypothetical protein